MNTIERPNSTPETLAVIEPAVYPIFTDSIPTREICEGRYIGRFARTRDELDAVLKLRFDVFNLELGEGLESSFLTSRDLDEFDDVCHHLIVEDTEGKFLGMVSMRDCNAMKVEEEKERAEMLKDNAFPNY